MFSDTVGHAAGWNSQSLRLDRYFAAWVLSMSSLIGTAITIGLGNQRHHAIEAGADRVHGTGLGVGERVGNASIDQILLNLKLLGEWEPDLSDLLLYCQAVSRACQVEIPYNYPMAGRDAFRTGTGVHAAAIVKAHKKGDHYLADRVYSGVLRECLAAIKRLRSAT